MYGEECCSSRYLYVVGTDPFNVIHDMNVKYNKDIHVMYCYVTLSYSGNINIPLYGFIYIY